MWANDIISFILDTSLCGDIDPVEEFSDILLANVRALVDEGTSKRNVLIIAAFEDDLVLESWATLDGNAVEHLNFVNLSTTEEIFEFDTLGVLSDDEVDGEMSVDESHPIAVALRRRLRPKCVGKKYVLPW